MKAESIEKIIEDQAFSPSYDYAFIPPTPLLQSFNTLDGGVKTGLCYFCSGLTTLHKQFVLYFAFSMSSTKNNSDEKKSTCTSQSYSKQLICPSFKNPRLRRKFYAGKSIKIITSRAI